MEHGEPAICQKDGCDKPTFWISAGPYAHRWAMYCGRSCKNEASRRRTAAAKPPKEKLPCRGCGRPLGSKTAKAEMQAHPSCIKMYKLKPPPVITDEMWTCPGPCGGLRTNIERPEHGYHSDACAKAAAAAQKPQASKKETEEAWNARIAKVVAKARRDGTLGPSRRLLDAVEAVRSKEEA